VNGSIRRLFGVRHDVFNTVGVTGYGEVTAPVAIDAGCHRFCASSYFLVYGEGYSGILREWGKKALFPWDSNLRLHPQVLDGP